MGREIKRKMCKRDEGFLMHERYLEYLGLLNQMLRSHLYLGYGCQAGWHTEVPSTGLVTQLAGSEETYHDTPYNGLTHHNIAYYLLCKITGEMLS